MGDREQAKPVLFTYVDNSNVWIEGQRVSAVRLGLARSASDAMNQKIVDPNWRYDFGRLYELICPDDARVGRAFLVGSRPPANDSLWELARKQGFEVKVFDRNVQNREKRVDTTIVVTLLDDSYQYMQPPRQDTVVLVAGDGDYIPAAESLHARGLRLRVVFWEHALSRDLRDVADEFVALDPHLDFLAR